MWGIFAGLVVRRRRHARPMAGPQRALAVVPRLAGLPGSVRRRAEVAPPAAYAVVDVETTGTSIEADEIVSLAVLRLDADGRELDRFASLVRPAGPIPAEATAVHGIDDAAVRGAPTFAELADELRALLEGAVFVAHNADFDLPLVQHAFARAGARYLPMGVACTLDAFRLLEPSERSHRLESLCERHGIELDDAHDARDDALATVELLRLLLGRGLPPRPSSSTTARTCAPARAATRGPRPTRRSGGSSRSPARRGSSGLDGGGRPRRGGSARHAGRRWRGDRRAEPRAGAGRLRRARADAARSFRRSLRPSA